MNDLEQQLQILRARVAKAAQACDDRVARLKNSPPQHAAGKLRLAHPEAPSLFTELEPAPALCGLHESEFSSLHLPGEEVETKLGRHLEKETLYAAHRRHGSADIGALRDLPHDLLDKVSGGAIPQAAPHEWAFVDTETTGLAGGTGTCAFLIGVGSIGRDGFRVRQFFMRDYGEEASQLDALDRHLKQFRVMITYNGKSFDQPLLETRYRMNRVRPPFTRLEHLDLLHGARRLWKLRFESCRLVDLENQILGFERAGDIPGALIPYVYFEYLRSRQAARLLAVFEHNALDILTLACLTGIVPHAFKDPENVPLRHGSEMTGLARWLDAAGDLEAARSLLRRAIQASLRDDLLFRAMWDLARLERKLDAETAALAIWEDLASARNPFRVQAMEELAKHYEHRAKDRQTALRWTRAAREIEDSPELQNREARLLKRIGSTARNRALL